MHAQRGDPRQRGRRPGRGIALALSLALHVAVLGALALRLDSHMPAAVARGVLVRLVLPPGTLVPAPDSDGVLPPQTAGAGGRVLAAGCRGAIYTGIGVRINVAGFIIDLAAGGPAERAGLRPGDAILNADDLPIDVYPVGHAVALRLLRDGRQAAAVVRIGAICNEPPAAVV